MMSYFIAPLTGLAVSFPKYVTSMIRSGDKSGYHQATDTPAALPVSIYLRWIS